MESLTKRRVRPVRVASLGAIVDRRPDGVTYVRSPMRLGEYPGKVTDRLEYWAVRAPQRIFLAQRGPSGEWQTTTYAEALTRVRRLARGLLDQGLSPEKPLIILSGNSVEHGLLALAAMYVGIPYAPIAPAYSLAVQEFTALSYIWQNFGPALVFVDDGSSFVRPLKAVLQGKTKVVFHRSPPRRDSFDLAGRLGKCRSFSRGGRGQPAHAARIHRQDSLYFRIHRPAQRSNYYPPHALFESTDAL